MVDEFRKMTSDRFTKLKYIEEDNDHPDTAITEWKTAYFDFDGVTASINPENKKLTTTT